MHKRVRAWFSSSVLLTLFSLVILLLAACGATDEPRQPTTPVLGTPGGSEMPVNGDAPLGTREPPGVDVPEGALRVTAFPIAQTDPALISSDAEVLIAS